MPTLEVTPEQREKAKRMLRGPLSSGQRTREQIIELALLGCGLASIGVTIAIAVVIFIGSLKFFTMGSPAEIAGDATNVEVKADAKSSAKLEVMPAEKIWARTAHFFTSTEFDESKKEYTILPLLVGTLSVTFIAALIALPIGIVTAIYLSEYATPRVRSIAKPMLELLAGIPTIVYGFFAVTVVTPFLAGFIPGLDSTFSQLSGGIVVAIMIVPTVASLSEDSLRAVPRSLRDGAIALGANKFETSVKVVLPAGLSGVVASFILAISRAIGETMAVTLACGGRVAFTFNPLTGISTMTGYIVRRSQGELDHDSTDYNLLFAIAGILFIITLSMNLIAQRVLKRYRQVYS